jgi:NAD(P)H-hydrate epimerase
LHNWGAEIALKILPGEEKLKNVPALQFHILEKMGILDGENINFDSIDLVIDAMIGYGLTGDPRELIADWIQRVNDAARSVLALDTPSGLDTTTGFPGTPCIRATSTMTLALPKTGLMSPEASEYVGDLYLADISVPPELYARLGIEAPHLFAHDTILKI